MTKRKWLRAVLIGGVLLLAASAGFSRALRASAARRYLIAHLTASFGRPVDVSWFDFSLLDGARIEAHFVSVADDPQFGNEYFLRADTLTAGLRWTALLAGRFEFGSVSLSPEFEFGARRRGPLEYRPVASTRFAARCAPRIRGAASPRAQCPRGAPVPNRRGGRAH